MEQSRQIWACVHHIIFRDALLRGIFATRISCGAFSGGKKMYLNIELNYYETYRNRKRSSEKSRDERDAF